MLDVLVWVVIGTYVLATALFWINAFAGRKSKKADMPTIDPHKWGYEISSMELSKSDLFRAVREFQERNGEVPEHDMIRTIIHVDKGSVTGASVQFYRKEHIMRGRLWLVKG